MRAIILSAAVLGVLWFVGAANAQGAFGPPPSPNPNRIPSYARPGLNMSGNMTWSQKLWGMIPDFKSFGARQGQVTSFPNPETDTANYLKGFGFRRLGH
jgi:hypothetical protein